MAAVSLLFSIISLSIAAMAKKKKNTWSSGQGRNLLRKDIKEGRIPNDMHWKEVYKHHFRPEFAVGPTPEDAERLFEGRLRTARKHVQSKDTRAEEEYRMFQQDRLLHPAPPFDANGNPRWQGSAAQLSLLDDVKKKKHLSMSKEDLYSSRPEYHSNYPKQYIFKKIDQAVKTEKFLKQMRKKKGHSNDGN